MRIPLEDELRAERSRLIETLDGLSDGDFDSGTTLCTRWAPRDVLGHLIGVDYALGSYLPYGVRINNANAAQVERIRRTPRRRLMEWARHWAEYPSPTSRLGAPFLLGDLGIHHQDILYGLGLTREVPRAVANAMLLEGLQLSLWLNRRVLRHRIVPIDGGRSYGCGPEVRGTREILGMWLSGRDSLAGELTFSR
jgi:uncharacterized protein (TIGR03083 family)